MTTFGINGLGRIGRTAVRVWWSKHLDRLDLKVINTSGSMELEDWVHLLKYDSNYGPFLGEITYQKHQSLKEVSDADPVLGSITINSSHTTNLGHAANLTTPDLTSTTPLPSKTITVTAQRDPAKIPWATQGVDTVIESTGAFTSREKASAHLTAGAKRVIISAPPKGGDIMTGIIGINEFPSDQTIVSNASCTTNCVGPVAAVMQQAFGIKKAMLTTIHSYTDDQNLHDNSHKDLRRARGAAQNIVPTTTGAAISVTETIPELKGLFDGLAVRVPTAVGSLSDLVFLVSRPTTIHEVNAAFEAAAQQEQWRNILAVTHDPIVSSDIKGRSESAIVDLSLTNVVDGDLVKVIAWYDNEFGYCNRLVEQVGRYTQTS